MALYEITSDNLKKIENTTYAETGLYERGDLQRLLKKQIEVVLPGTLIISEEFGEWDASRRRIDLLGIDVSGDIVVIEIKRTEDGGHMELQAIRYAAMVADMTFEDAVETFSKYLSVNRIEGDARERLLEHLNWAEPDVARFAQDVRIVLLSSDFSKELTTAVMWLSTRKEIDIKCIRLVPYSHEGRTLMDVQQIIPLPEAADYQVKVKRKAQEENRERTANSQQFRFWQTLLDTHGGRHEMHERMTPNPRSYMGASTGVRGVTFFYTCNREDQRVEIYVDRGESDVNKDIFAQLEAHKEEIEAAFGQPLSWEGLFGKRACRIAYRLPYIGNTGNESDWPAIHETIVEAMQRFEAAMSPHIATLRV